MSIFTFTVACGVTPTPTPTPRPTPVPWCCYEYSTFNESGVDQTVYYDDCAGNATSKTVSAGYDSIPCSKQYSQYDPSGFVYFTEGAQCYTVPTDCEATPTPTPTPTPTSTITPTPTAIPNYTVSIYAKRSGTPTCIIPPGSGTEPQFRIYYSFGLGVPYNQFLIGGNIASNSCGFVGDISVPSGTTLYIGCRSWSYNSPIKFGVASGTSTCPDSGLTAYCGAPFDFGGTGVYSQVITGNTSLAFTSNLISQYKLAPDGKSTVFDCYKFDYCGGTGGN